MAIRDNSAPESNTAGERVSVPLAVGQQEASNDEGFDADGEQVISTQTVGAQAVKYELGELRSEGG